MFVSLYHPFRDLCVYLKSSSSSQVPRHSSWSLQGSWSSVLNIDFTKISCIFVTSTLGPKLLSAELIAWGTLN